MESSELFYDAYNVFRLVVYGGLRRHLLLSMLYIFTFFNFLLLGTLERIICTRSDDATLRIWNPILRGLICLAISSTSFLALTGSEDVNITTWIVHIYVYSLLSDILENVVYAEPITLIFNCIFYFKQL